MNIVQFHDSDKPDVRHLLLAADVSKARLDVYGRYTQAGVRYELMDSFLNDLPTVHAKLDDYARQACALGYRGLALVVEPSGCYEKKLTQAAIRKGHTVWMVNPERMYKAGVLHHGDDGKSDPLDGQVLHMMARMGKVSRMVELASHWQQLRQLGQWLEDCTLSAADARIRLGEVRRALFCDYHQSTDLSWGATGRSIQACYGFDPWKITSGSYGEFVATIRAHNVGVPERGLAGIWQQALQSRMAELGESQRTLIGEQLEYIWQAWKRQEHRKQQLREQMVGITRNLSDQEWLPPIFPGFTEVMRAKILAETGPLQQFPHWRALVAYAGLKIRMRQSGKYRGRDKITKKGRILLRKHLGQAAFTLARKDRVLGPYYHRKRAEGMPPRKAKVACMRKLLKMLYGASKSGQAFSSQRMYHCAG
ncbi:MAG: IS110 family transposase [Pseudomonadales bacterium]|jgi:transposase|nr:IS110 family transposase [Pseudomonadales bacterium]